MITGARPLLRHLHGLLISLAAGTALGAGPPDMSEAGFRLGRVYAELRVLRNRPDTLDTLRTPEMVEAEIDGWRQRGFKDTTPVRDGEFFEHPDAKQGTLPFSAMTLIAKEYRDRYPVYQVHFGLRAADQTLTSIREGHVKPTDDLAASAIAHRELHGNADRCLELVALGKSRDATMKIGRRGASLEEFERDICPALATVVPAWVSEARAAFRARRAKEAAPFVAAGITGQKLDLMVTYSGVAWRLPGGERTDAPARLAKAGVLYQLLEAQDKHDARYVVYTVRRYVFAGDRVSQVSESQARRHHKAAVNDLFK